MTRYRISKDTGIDQATLYRTKRKIPLPEGGEIIPKRKQKIARYRDAAGIERRVFTDCRDEQAARHVLTNLLADAERI